MAATRKKNINPRVERKITRISGVREVKQTFLIICEGVNTEPDYFNAFRSEQDGSVKLVSNNPHHDPNDIPVRCIETLALVNFNIRMNVIV